MKSELLYQILITAIPVIGMYWNMKDKIVRQESRNTSIEKDILHLHEFKLDAQKRLDNHDEQNRALFTLAEQVKQLSNDIKRLEDKMG